MERDEERGMRRSYPQRKELATSDWLKLNSGGRSQADVLKKSSPQEAVGSSGSAHRQAQEQEPRFLVCWPQTSAL